MMSRYTPFIILAIGAAIIIYMNMKHSSPCMGTCDKKHEHMHHGHEHHEHGEQEHN